MEKNKKKSNGNETFVEMSDGVSARIDGKFLIIKGAKGENKRDISEPCLVFNIEGNKIKISTERRGKKGKNMVFTYAAHVKNMIFGVKEGYKYTLKICSSHFPMNVSMSKNQLIIKNFIGEKEPRLLDIKTGATVKVEGEIISIEGTDKEIVGTIASDIEKMTKRPAFDARIYQDGIYITKKD